MAHSVVTLDQAHDVKSFDCGTAVLNIWLQTTARQHQKKSLSSTFVLVDDDNPECIVGFYTLAIRGLMPITELPSTMTSRLPLHIPGLTLARLAIAASHQRKGYGELLLVDAMLRAKEVTKQTGGFALFVDAKDDKAANFYTKYGFVPLISYPPTLAIPIASITL